MNYCYRNAVYSRSNNSMIDCEINHSEYGWIPYTLTSASNNAMWNTVTSGSVGAYSDPSDSVLYVQLRSTRDKLLADSDWTQVGDLVSSGAMTSDKLTEWKTYRQSLRDLPSNTSDPSNVTWPTKPT